MDVMIKYGISEINKSEWSDFLSHHPKKSVFQTPQMYECYEQTPNHEPYLFTAFVISKIVGILLVVIIQESGFLKKQLSTRAIIQGGPIIKDDNPYILKEILTACDVHIGKKAIYTQIRNQFEQLSQCDIFRELGYKFESHLNYLIHLDNETAIWSRIGKGRISQVKKAQKMGLSVQAYDHKTITDDLLRQGYSIIEEVYSRANLPLVDISQMFAANKQGILVMFVITTKEGETAGCRFALAYENSLYGWYAGSRSKYYSLYPNALLIWETLRWGCVKGYEIFDYGGAGSPNKSYGVRSFKSQLGGELVNFGRYEKVNNPLKMFIGKNGYYFYKALFKF